MRVVIQRVSEASVTIEGKKVAEIRKGLLVLLGITDADTQEDIDYLVRKTANLRIFNDENHVMNLSLKDVNADVIVVSQFTLFANVKKGNRPSYGNASKPGIAIPLYEKFIADLEVALQKEIQTGEFGEDMKVHLSNDGPVTIIIDSNLREF